MNTRKIILSLTMGVCLIISSCNSGARQSGSADLRPGEGSNEANEMITFNNKLVKADNSHSSFIRTFRSNLEGVERFITGKLENPSGMAIAPVSVPAISINNLQGIVYPDGWSKEYQPLVKDMEDSFEALKGLQKEIDAYRSAEDWKEDNGGRIAEFKEKGLREIEKNRTASRNLFERIRPQVSEAEETILDGHPLKDQIIRSKDIMELTQQIHTNTYDMEDLNTFNSDFEKSYTELEALYKENKENELPEDYQNKTRSFISFNDAVNDYLGKMRIIKRETDAGNVPSEQNFRDFDTATENVLRTYNNFVD